MSKTVEQQMPQKGSLLVLVSLWQCVCMALACCPCLCVWRVLFDLCLGRHRLPLYTMESCGKTARTIDSNDEKNPDVLTPCKGQVRTYCTVPPSKTDFQPHIPIQERVYQRQSCY